MAKAVSMNGEETSCRSGSLKAGDHDGRYGRGIIIGLEGNKGEYGKAHDHGEESPPLPPGRDLKVAFAPSCHAPILLRLSALRQP
jgi:hypothetical protein